MKEIGKGAESGRMPEGRKHADKSAGHNGRIMNTGAESGCMPYGRKKADTSGEYGKPWKSNGER
jgi:hypothetical protein